MPELPEVETTLRAIEKFKHQKLNEIKIHNRNLRWVVDKSLERKSKNQKVLNLYRRAKYIIFELENVFLLLHLGMSGSLRINNIKDNYFFKHDHIEFIFDKEKVIYNDPRRFGSLHLCDDANNHRLISALGPEPLSKGFNGKYLLECCKRSKTSIKTLLMNQKNVVGIGNIYASESLYLSEIDPKKNSQKLTLEECNKLASSSKRVLKEAIKVGGTTLKNFYSADGSPGYFSIKLNVYGRDGQECKKCKQEIQKLTINQRATFYCPNCQN
ncbi:bifunctional DNA-formamidopyrimidine glycosylase/DNA-(apurinic or apyrimidinic site) lyase [Gammaproteobacteria bacterium]|nr:bifunctional DNA-formamidopyrimidine glycosylase/DNA-(apurinic or apyrimidinic site) lyase [Gammaproteobacteria bacterium]